MVAETPLHELRQYLHAGYGLIALNTFEEERWLPDLENLARSEGRQLEQWSTISSEEAYEDLLEQLKVLTLGDNTHRMLLLKDIHAYLDDPQIVRALREVSQQGALHYNTVLLMGPDLKLPLELEKEAIVIDLPLPDYETMQLLIQEIFSENELGANLESDLNERERLAQALLGLTLSQAERTLNKSARRCRKSIE
ncbi:MAG: hypothetical protein R3C11_27570 [Planctomycetaceae bacterium]